jgi:hypothetical protein
MDVIQELEDADDSDLSDRTPLLPPPPPDSMQLTSVLHVLPLEEWVPPSSLPSSVVARGSPSTVPVPERATMPCLPPTGGEPRLRSGTYALFPPDSEDVVFDMDSRGGGPTRRRAP